MIKKLVKKIVGDRYERELKKLQPLLQEILAIYETLNELSDDELRAKIVAIKAEIQDEMGSDEEELANLEKEYQTEPDENQKSAIGNRMNRLSEILKKKRQNLLDSHLPTVYAIVKDTCRRMMGQTYDIRDHKAEWDMIPFDVQLIGGIVLHQGKIAEMATGEGKTLVATLPLFLNALLGHGVHLITVNDYLAQRDAEWMSPIFEFHGMKVGCITNGMSPQERKNEYECDVTYGTNSEFGFDYLRDNMAISIEQLVQRKHQYAIVDEVDSVLIDEARTPLIISGPVQESKNFFKELKPVILKLFNSQNMLIKQLLTRLKKLLENPDYDVDEAGQLLLTIYRGDPKNKSFLKLLKNSELKKMLTDYEGYYIRDKKMHEIDAELFYFVEEKANSVELSEKGNDLVAYNEPDLFIMEQLDGQLEEVDKDETLSFEEKAKKKDDLTSKFLDKNEKLHNIKQLLKSYALFEKDVDYVVVENKVMIVDQFTGRMMQGRRFSDGLHQALEAKENVTIEEATQTFATITLQNYFRMYEKLAGMTGTAITEEGEFLEIYKLPVSVIPTNLPISRIDHNDMIYLTKNEKYKAIINEIEYWYNLQKPVLVGTVSVEVSETLSRLLRRRGINHSVLNAKYHEKEAEIISKAGEPGSVTIATNMAGRGTDIKLGKGVVSREKEYYLQHDSKITEENPYGFPLDGLHVIGTERHESRRIDRQLRGRSGRQGDPGTSRFYLSMEDDLMRLFGSERMAPMMMKMGLKDGEAITHPWMTKTVETAQKRVESYNFEIRKQLIKYDEVMNQQREVIYNYRRNVLKGYDLKFEIIEMIKDTIADVVEQEIDRNEYSENWDFDSLLTWMKRNLNLQLDLSDFQYENVSIDILIEDMNKLVLEAYQKREQELGEEHLREIERRALLSVVDELWREHLHEMDLLKEGIGFRAYGQKDPLIEYKKESFVLFQELVININKQVTKKVFTSYILSREQIRNLIEMGKFEHGDISAFAKKTAPPTQTNKAHDDRKQTPRKVELKVGRNDPCPCGSGKKYKKCCGKITTE